MFIMSIYQLSTNKRIPWHFCWYFFISSLKKETKKNHHAQVSNLHVYSFHKAFCIPWCNEDRWYFFNEKLLWSRYCENYTHSVEIIFFLTILKVSECSLFEASSAWKKQTNKISYNKSVKIANHNAGLIWFILPTHGPSYVIKAFISWCAEGPLWNEYCMWVE